jgi:hypothetical protein
MVSSVTKLDYLHLDVSSQIDEAKSTGMCVNLRTIPGLLKVRVTWSME